MLCTKAGLKNIGTVFLLTDAQIPEEHFLVLINDLLASGEIPGLFPDDEVENIISGVRNEVKGAGLQDTRENCWMFFIERIRRNLKVATICMAFKVFILPRRCHWTTVFHLVTSRDAKARTRQVDRLKLVSRKICREQVGTVPTFFLYARTNSSSGKQASVGILYLLLILPCEYRYS